jgi:error-prone DNA polymerase
MPEKPDYHKRPHPAGRLRAARAAIPARSAHAPAGYAELRCKSNFSFLQGASHPEELVERASQLGYFAIALTDLNSLAGMVRMHCAAKEFKIKLLVGAEITPIDATPLLLYATDRASYGRLATIITRGRLRAKKGDCRVTFQDIADHANGLIAAVVGNTLVNDDLRITRYTRSWHDYHDLFPNCIYLAVSIHGGSDDKSRLDQSAALSRQFHIPMVATNDVHYHVADRRFLQDVLTCVRQGCPIADAGQTLFANAERHLKPAQEMHRLFGDYPQALARTLEIAERCQFCLDELRYEYPEALCPAGCRPGEYLAELTWTGARVRYPSGVPDKVRKLLEHELRLIGDLSYEPYFLTVWDIVQFARSKDIFCQGRGSAANSAVCYCLGITSVDPDRVEMLFERFVSSERNEPPDIDVDFEHERREEVFQYIYNKYGRDHAGIVAEVITYRPRSAIRDVGKALGLSLDCVDTLAKKHGWWDRQALPAEFLREAGIDPADRTIQLLVKLVRDLLGFPRHLSQHVGGFVMTRGPLSELVPIESAAMPDRTLIQWDKDDIDALGILKVDCLALGMLTAIQKCLRLLVPFRSSDPLFPRSLSDVPPEDFAVYDMIGRADTIGVFQIESRAQMSMLPRLKPKCYYDLVIEVAIVRPGPIQGGMVHPYLRRRSGEEPVTYPNEAIREVLHRTLGVPLFQEQAMRLAIVAAGFTPGEADQLRRAMGAWRRDGHITYFREKLIKGMLVHGLSQEFAERCFEQIAGFGEYGFPESHAASFALLVYVSAWLKRYHPAAFCAALINSQPMGFYQPAQLVRDAIQHGVTVLPIDVNYSGYDCRLDSCQIDNRTACGATIDNSSVWGVGGPAVRLGMRLIKGISQEQVVGIEQAQGQRPFTSLVDLSRRSGASRATLARLAAADAFGSLGLDRRQAVWDVLALTDEPPLLRQLEPIEPPASLPRPTMRDVVLADYDIMGLSLNAHPMSLIREDLSRIKVRPSRDLQTTKAGERMRVAGIVLVRQRPSTAKGIVFCTIEDETGTANLIIRPDIYGKYRTVAGGAAAIIASGHVERQGDVVHLLVEHLDDAAGGLCELRSQSRDFH